jgi:hypothetical protein
MIPETLIVNLYGNANKLTDLHPDLVGSFALDGKSYDLADWIRTTLDLKRQYHSIIIHEAEKRKRAVQTKTKCEPVAKLKLYECRKRLGSDPDFFSREPFILAGIAWYAALLIRLKDDPDDLETMSFELTLSRQPVRQAPTPEAVHSMRELRNRLVEREKQRQAEPAGNEEPDDPPF